MMLHRAIEQCSNSSRPACSSCWLVNIFNHTHSPSNPSEMISSFFFRSLLSGYVTFFSALSNKPPPFFFYFHSCLVFTFFVLLRLYSLASRPATCLTFCLCLTVETLDLVAVLTERGNHRMAQFGVLFFWGGAESILVRDRLILIRLIVSCVLFFYGVGVRSSRRRVDPDWPVFNVESRWGVQVHEPARVPMRLN